MYKSTIYLLCLERQHLTVLQPRNQCFLIKINQKVSEHFKKQIIVHHHFTGGLAPIGSGSGYNLEMFFFFFLTFIITIYYCYQSTSHACAWVACVYIQVCMDALTCTFTLCSSRKYPILPPQKVFVSHPPLPPGNSGLSSYIAFLTIQQQLTLTKSHLRSTITYYIAVNRWELTKLSL